MGVSSLLQVATARWKALLPSVLASGSTSSFVSMELGGPSPVVVILQVSAGFASRPGDGIWSCCSDDCRLVIADGDCRW